MISFALKVLAAILLIRSVPANKEGVCSSFARDGECCEASRSDSDDVSLMQIALSASRRGSKSGKAISRDHVDNNAQCSDLANKGAYFTVPVSIGTPEQKFHLVADTGSDALIIPDCKCVEAGYCEALDTCFAAGNSTSFGLDVKPTKKQDSLAVMGAKMNYGSGQIQVLVASEMVRVGETKTQMHNGVFLMEDRRALKVHGDFEGILGLGLPHESPLTKKGVQIPAFMQSSKVSKYTLCFNEFPKPGALRAAVASLPNPLTNIGTVHWGLDLQGFSVGEADTPVIFCNPKMMGKSQKTACGAIPDSGTTLMMGPADHIRKLFSALCERWPRCKKAAQDSKESKARAFHELLYACESWMTDDQGVHEIPSIFLHLAGAEGKPQTVELSAWSYIVETTQELYKVVTAKVFGGIPMAAAIDTGKKKKICTASFGPQEYTTVQNGPVWIMGAPLFYATTVGYDLGSGGDKTKISFIDGPCTLCNATASLISAGSATQLASVGHISRRLPRLLAGPIREPAIDVSGPL